jgi:hypothetical protein
VKIVDDKNISFDLIFLSRFSFCLEKLKGDTERERQQNKEYVLKRLHTDMRKIQKMCQKSTGNLQWKQISGSKHTRALP